MKRNQCVAGEIDFADLPEAVKPLGHHRISFEFAASLVRHSRLLSERLAKIPEATNLLFVHGEADTVCPAALSSECFERITDAEKSYVSIPEGLHELFIDPVSKGLALSTVRSWLQRVVQR